MRPLSCSYGRPEAPVRRGEAAAGSVMLRWQRDSERAMYWGHKMNIGWKTWARELLIARLNGMTLGCSGNGIGRKLFDKTREAVSI